jgi:hypothetical protein
MRQRFENMAVLMVCGIFSVVVLTGGATFGAERSAAGKTPHQPQPAHAAAKHEIKVDVVKNLDGLHESLCDKLTRLAVDVLSGNVAYLLSGNCPELLSGNKPKLLSENCPNVLSGNQTPILSGNRFSVLSDIKVEVNIHINNSGNSSENK